MKILIIPSWYPYPGNPLAGKFFIDQASALAKHTGHDYYLLNFGQNEYQLRLKQPGLIPGKLRSFLSARSQTRQLAERLWEISIPHLSWTNYINKGNLDRLTLPLDLQVDLIYALVSYPAGYLAMRLARQMRVPYLIAEHSGPFPFPQFLKGGRLSPLILEPIQKANKVIAISSFLQSQILEHTGITADIIPNMVDTDFFVPAKHKSPAQSLRLFSMSAFTAAKGTLELLKALHILARRNLDFEMVWAGEGALQRQIMQKAARLPIRFPGTLKPLQALKEYQSCDLYVMPSRIESFSMVLIEAMSCGVPAVATSCGGPKDIVTAQTGILCEPQNAGALAKAILEYHSRSSDFDPVQIRSQCVKLYSEGQVCAQLNDIFERF
ncbi:MAG: glycosyltransferase [Candidatus Cloacimonadaceae bacterium]|jgi:glycosyltransferase involved in cell wall biosynthesis|nr:glycosyltransferase [Candidatus Cloacimonadota bacterium]MDY0126507.1 glycosyltransferase [Candidatus Cloacimonadaceae bacterium]MCB5255410.1 glycosyltransferase [Candidatus Cloacimonadota bacterium]MCK9177559.1 glycosyltransferase [Candidatus Cloacimonadota bacterium]MCK9242201.1 glycosyltransferase [Candidatus Cloacimonadota bacterium]